MKALHYTTLRHICWMKSNIKCNPILLSYYFLGADSKKSDTPHLLTKYDVDFFFFLQPFVCWSLVLSFNQERNWYKDMTYIFLCVRLQLFVQFLTDFHMHEWFWKLFYAYFKILIMSSDRRKCKYDRCFLLDLWVFYYI